MFRSITSKFLLIIALLLPSVSWGAVAFDSTFETYDLAASSPVSFASNAGNVTGSVGANSNRALFGCVAFNATIATVGTVSMNWDATGSNQAMTAITSVDIPGGGGSLFLFGLKNPASGILTLQASWSGGGAHDLAVGVVSLYNVEQTTAAWNNAGTDTGTSTSPGSTVTTTLGDMAVVCHINRNATTTTINVGTSDWIEGHVDNNSAQAHSAASGSSTPISWTLSNSVAWANVKTNAVQVGGGGGGGGTASRLTLMGIGP